MNVVVRSDEGAAASLLVDEIGDVIQVSTDAQESVPQTVPASLRAMLRGVFKLDERLLLELDTDKLVSGGDGGRL